MLPLLTNAAPEIFLYIEDVQGESTFEGLDGWIEVSAYDESQFQPVEGSRSTSGRADFGDVHIIKPLDKASPQLRYLLASGAIIPAVNLRHYKTIGAEQKLFFQISMKSVVVSEVSAAATGGSSPEETLALNFGQVTWSYTQFDDGGRQIDQATSYWDVIRNDGNQSSSGGCDSSPCQNGGSCVAVTGGNYYCECPVDYTGSNCQIFDLDACSDSPCDKIATCTDDPPPAGAEGFSCECPAGYSGTGLPGDCTDLMFENGFEGLLGLALMSSVEYSVDFPVLEGTDLKCNALAASAGLPGTYPAWLSTRGSAVNAKDRVGDNK